MLGDSLLIGPDLCIGVETNTLQKLVFIKEDIPHRLLVPLAQ
jgi:hypothetical protein